MGEESRERERSMHREGERGGREGRREGGKEGERECIVKILGSRMQACRHAGDMHTHV